MPIRKTILLILAVLIAVASFLFGASHARSQEKPYNAYADLRTKYLEIQAKQAAQLNDALFQRIAMCESTNNPLAKNSHSTASGRYQFLKGSWEYYGEKHWGEAWVYYDVFNYDDNTELAWYVYNSVGTSPWNASKHCWG